MAQITPAEIKGYIKDQLQGYDKQVATPKYAASKTQTLDPDGYTSEFSLFQGVDSDMNQKELIHVENPKGGSGGSVDFETEDIDFDKDWDSGNKSDE